MTLVSIKISTTISTKGSTGIIPPPVGDYVTADSNTVTADSNTVDASGGTI